MPCDGCGKHGKAPQYAHTSHTTLYAHDALSPVHITYTSTGKNPVYITLHQGDYFSTPVQASKDVGYKTDIIPEGGPIKKDVYLDNTVREEELLQHSMGGSTDASSLQTLAQEATNVPVKITYDARQAVELHALEDFYQQAQELTSALEKELEKHKEVILN